MHLPPFLPLTALLRGKTLINSILKFIGINKWLLIAIGISLTSGWLLLNAYQKLGESKAETANLHIANKAWLQFWKDKKMEFDLAQKRLEVREQEYQKIEGQLNEYKAKLREIIGDSSDCGVRPDVWLLIQDSAAAGSLPRN